MSIKDKLKKIPIVKKIYHFLRNGAYTITTIISPKLNTVIHYYEIFGKVPDLNNPKTFNEKLLWLKLNDYIKNPLVIQCCDKVAVREYVKRNGYEQILNEVIGVYESPIDIPWNDLPKQFVLKWNFGAGMNIICKNKAEMCQTDVLGQLETWGKCKYWLSHSEMQYKYVEKKIICEKFLVDETLNDLPDYKVYCFHGEPQAIFVMQGRGEKIQTEFFDVQWNSLENSNKYETPEISTSRPICLDEMLCISRRLAKPFPFVRCDFYIVNGRLYFGELTFTPAGGLFTSETLIHGKSMTEFLKLNIK